MIGRPSEAPAPNDAKLNGANRECARRRVLRRYGQPSKAVADRRAERP